MSRAIICHGEIQERNKRFLGIHLEMKNADLVLLSEGEDQLGTLAVAIPQARGRIGPPLSSTLLGDRNLTTTRLLAERLAGKTNKISLVSIFAKTVNEREAAPIFLRLFEEIVGKREGKK